MVADTGALFSIMVMVLVGATLFKKANGFRRLKLD